MISLNTSLNCQPLLGSNVASYWRGISHLPLPPAPADNISKKTNKVEKSNKSGLNYFA